MKQVNTDGSQSPDLHRGQEELIVLDPNIEKQVWGFLQKGFRKGGEQINIQWFYLLYSNEKIPGLFTMVPEIESKFCVSRHISIGDNKIKLFSAWNNLDEFLDYFYSISEENRNFFEVILGSSEQKIYYDIDIESKVLAQREGSSSVTSEELDQFTQEMMFHLLSCLKKNFEKFFNLPLDLSKDVLIFSSQNQEDKSSTKRSYHLVFPHHHLINYFENRKVCLRLLDGLDVLYLAHVDTLLYKSLQQFRLLGNHKPEVSHRTKELLTSWSFTSTLKDETISGSLSGSPELLGASGKSINPFQRESFYASVVTYTRNSQNLSTSELTQQILSEKFVPFWQQKGAFKGSEEDNIVITEEIKKEIFNRVNLQVFSLGKCSSQIIELRRRKPAFCPACQRTHDSENAFIVVSRRERAAFFHCWRAQHQGKSARVEVCDLKHLIPIDPEVLERTQRMLQSVIPSSSMNPGVILPEREKNDDSSSRDRSPKITNFLEREILNSQSCSSPLSMRASQNRGSDQVSPWMKDFPISSSKNSQNPRVKDSPVPSRNQGSYNQNPWMKDYDGRKDSNTFHPNPWMKDFPVPSPKEPKKTVRSEIYNMQKESYWS